MDVTLVLTHRCNLACHYCYAGTMSRRDMSPEVMERALDLLFSDGAKVAQLGFFGGEPFLALAEMQRAIEGARARAAAAGGRLIIACTTNGTRLMRAAVDLIANSGLDVTVSLDGVREAHEENRPVLGGTRSSFDEVCAGLQALLDAQVVPTVNMVITPATVPFLLRSATWLWGLGVRRLNVSLDLGATWSWVDRDLLRRELTAVARTLLWQRLQGEAVSFLPFAVASSEAGPIGTPRPQVVVGTTGNLYACAPMVGEDRDEGPEAALRLGHLRDGGEAILASVDACGAGCHRGESAGLDHPCACAAFLETGSRDQLGPVGRWFGRLCTELGAAIEAGLEEARERAGHDFLREVAQAEADALKAPPSAPRSSLLRMLIYSAGGLALAAGLGSALKPRAIAPGKALRLPPPTPTPTPPTTPRPPSPELIEMISNQSRFMGIIAVQRMPARYPKPPRNVTPKKRR